MAHQSPLSKDKVVWSWSVLTFDLHSLSFFVLFNLFFFFFFSSFSCSYHSERCNPFRPGAESRPSLGEDVCCRISLGWMTLSSAGRAIGMQSTIPIQLLAQNSLSSSLSRPDLATTLHNLLNYSRLEEETDILTSAPLHVKQALFGLSSCTSPNVIWVDTVLSFCWTNNTFGGSHILLRGETAALGRRDVSGMDMAQAATELTVSTKYIGQPTANKARGWMDGSPIHEP